MHIAGVIPNLFSEFLVEAVSLVKKNFPTKLWLCDAQGLSYHGCLRLLWKPPCQCLGPPKRPFGRFLRSHYWMFVPYTHYFTYLTYFYNFYSSYDTPKPSWNIGMSTILISLVSGCQGLYLTFWLCHFLLSFNKLIRLINFVLRLGSSCEAQDKVMNFRNVTLLNN